MNISIGYGQIDPSAKIDSIPTSTDKQPWVNLNDLKIDGLIVKNIQTCEHNQGILDGTQEHLPDNPEKYEWGYWSESMSDDDGMFSAPPTLDIGFQYTHKSPGLTFLFYPHSDDYAKQVRVTWYDSTNAIIISGTYNFTSTIGQIDESVTEFKRIKIEFLSTNIRNRYIKLAGLNYGIGRTFADEEIDSVQILEQIDPISENITVNTLNFRIKTFIPEFSLVAGDPDDNMLMINQQFYIVGDGRSFGTFFLDFPWDDTFGDGHTFDFRAIDPIGAMGQYNFWGDIYVNMPVDTLISKIFAVAFPTQLIRYEIDPAFAGKAVSGWIPICTCRQALQQVCFAIGAVADDSRRDFVWIYPPDIVLDDIMQPNELYRPAKISPTTYWSGVAVTAHEYVPSDEVVEVHNGIRYAGRHELKFDEPIYNLQPQGCDIIEKSANHAIINVPTTGIVILSGNKYIVNKPVFTIKSETNPNQVENIKRIENCTLTHPSEAPAIAQNIYEYLNQRAQYEGDIRLTSREPGYMVQIPTYARPIDGTIHSLDINLRAERARMKVIGSVVNPSNI